MEKDNLMQAAMQMILKAGDARQLTQDALDELSRFCFDDAAKTLASARREWVEAHHAQTEIIQQEISGQEPTSYSMLFTHAQDTLMTVNSEMLLAEKMLIIFRAMDARYNPTKEAK